MFYVYVLRSKRDRQLYFGSTQDLVRRLREHNAGMVFSTRTRRPFGLIYYEAYRAESDARRREHQLKLRANAFAQLKLRLRDSLSSPD